MAAAENISDAFTAIHGHPVTVDPRHIRSQPALALIYGWTQQTFLYGRAAIPLLRDRDRAAVPLAREAFECGMHVQWMRWVPGSDIATVRRDARTRRTLATDLTKLQHPMDLDDVVQALIDQADENDRAVADLEAPSHLPHDFKSVCTYFDQGEVLYLHCRLLSLEAHPTASSADGWLGLSSDGELVFQNPDPPDTHASQLLVMAFVLASSGLLDVMRANGRTRRFRSTINGAARTTGLLRTRLKPKTHS